MVASLTSAVFFGGEVHSHENFETALDMQQSTLNSFQTFKKEKEYQNDLQKALENSFLSFKEDELRREIKLKEDLYQETQNSLKLSQDKVDFQAMVIGSGPAAHAFAHNAAMDRLNMAMILGPNPGGALNVKTKVKNFEGEKEKYGYEVMYNRIGKSESLRIPMLHEQVHSVDLTQFPYRVHTNKRTYKTKAVVLSHGTKPRSLEIKGVKDYKVWGDEAWYNIGDFKKAARGKNAIVIGGSIDAFNKARNLLEGGAQKVYLSLRNAAEIPQDLRGKVDLIIVRKLLQVLGDKQDRKPTHILLENGQRLAIDMIVNATGRVANDNIAIKANTPLKIDMETGRFIVQANMKTNIPGVFAMGDIAAEMVDGKIFHNDGRAVIAQGKGARAEIGVLDYLSRIKK